MNLECFLDAGLGAKRDSLQGAIEAVRSIRGREKISTGKANVRWKSVVLLLLRQKPA
jgi:hypothetical protein